MNDLRERLLAFLRDGAARPLEPRELMAALAVPAGAQKAFLSLLEGLESEGLVVRTRVGRYGVPERMNLVVGTFQGHERGFGFVVPLQPGGEDLFIAPEAMGGAMNGDRVVARRAGRGRGGRQPEGEVIRVLHRANPRVVGTFEREKGVGFVTPDEKRLPFAIVVPAGAAGKARSGDKVVVEVTRWPEARRAPEGRVVESLGRSGAPGVDILSVMHRYGLPSRFPPEVEAAAAGVPEAPGPEDLAGRADLRGLLCVTIDGERAKDFDDAVSLQPLEGKAGWRLGVHIADVSHYVPEGGTLDREARERATSTYLVDRVVPMLPARLSDGICSLNPGVDRLTVTVWIDFDAKGRPGRRRIAPSVIRSRARLTYNAVWAAAQGGGTAALRRAPAVALAATAAEEAALEGMLRDMLHLAGILRERRLARGAIDFDLPEAEVLLDAEGRPREVRRAERNPAHRMIEAFMLAANETVAATLAGRGAPLLHRVHEPPDAEKVEALAELLRALGIPFQVKDKPRPRDFQAVLERVRGRPEEALVSAVMLRSMKQARYAAERLGHFGLATDDYCHFTSPIRRYPDLVVHRVVKAVAAGGTPPPAWAERLAAALPDTADHCSRRERVAAEAEMETVKIKMAEYMAAHLGETFDGIISGVTAFGFFVQLENLVEGLVHVSTLTDDYYRFDEKTLSLLGERTRRRFRLGDRVRVQVARAGVENRSVDFVMV